MLYSLLFSCSYKQHDTNTNTCLVFLMHVVYEIYLSKCFFSLLLFYIIISSVIHSSLLHSMEVLFVASFVGYFSHALLYLLSISYYILFPFSIFAIYSFANVVYIVFLCELTKHKKSNSIISCNLIVKAMHQVFLILFIHV